MRLTDQTRDLPFSVGRSRKCAWHVHEALMDDVDEDWIEQKKASKK